MCGYELRVTDATKPNKQIYKKCLATFYYVVVGGSYSKLVSLWKRNPSFLYVHFYLCILVCDLHCHLCTYPQYIGCEASRCAWLGNPVSIITLLYSYDTRLYVAACQNPNKTTNYMQQSVVKFIALSYRYCSTCFGHYNAHHQEPVKLPLQRLVSYHHKRYG